MLRNLTQLWDICFVIGRIQWKENIMKKLISAVVVITMVIGLMYCGYRLGKRDIGEMYQPPLPEYTAINTNLPAVTVQTEQLPASAERLPADITVESSPTNTMVVYEPSAKYTMATPAKAQPKFVSEHEVRDMQQAAAKEQINRSNPQPEVQNYRPPQFKSGNQ
jgi:hypothetical protein